MKRLIPLSLIITTLILQSCNQENSSKIAVDTAFTQTCYVAIDGKDTAKLSLKDSGENIEGELLIKFDKKDRNEGTFKGSYRGDTLFVDYNFRVGDKKPGYINPLALLKKDGKLIMGVGKIKSTLGRNYLSKDEPIDFSAGRFIFEPVDCK